ncbi:uncharacterized protein CCOS01_10514 [Colletotrichum costaricense]|uniref:Uncharacterized protein n=2 Tax=Colletotrichum acutatum species complex TaxID=2707335 RepID=A0AAI9YQX2_9PEZI|nr:uncharacterized protein CCOS01_10514 [Colletotrichum costaricense]KAK1520395.1 hypothetical protein CCOS01_10514 [Colletotrichum costaricense]
MPNPLCVALIRQAGFCFFDQESHPAVSITPRRARPATTGWKGVRDHGTLHWAKRISIARTKSVFFIVALMTREGLFATRRKRTDIHPCSPKVYPSVVDEKQEQLNSTARTGRNKVNVPSVDVARWQKNSVGPITVMKLRSSRFNAARNVKSHLGRDPIRGRL